MSKNHLARMLMQFAGDENIITVNRAFVDFAGSLEGGMMLSQLLYWTPRSKNNGWIAKGDDEFAKELCSTGYKIRKERQNLLELQVIETKLKKFSGTPKIHYRVLVDALIQKWTLRFEQVDSVESQNELFVFAESLTENTTENQEDEKETPIFHHKKSDGTWAIIYQKTNADVHALYDNSAASLVGKTVHQKINAEVDEWDAHANQMPASNPQKNIDGNTAVYYAIESMMEQINKPKISYLRAIIENWIEKGFMAPKPSRRSPNGKHPQAEWDEDEMEATRQSARERIKLAKEK